MKIRCLRCPRGNVGHNVLCGAISHGINQATCYQICAAQSQRCTSNQSSRSPSAYERLFPPSCQEYVEAGPGGANAGSVDFVLIEIQIGAEQQDRRKEGREKLRWSKSLRCYKGCQKCWWNGILCKKDFSAPDSVSIGALIC